MGIAVFKPENIELLIRSRFVTGAVCAGEEVQEADDQNAKCTKLRNGGSFQTLCEAAANAEIFHHSKRLRKLR